MVSFFQSIIQYVEIAFDFLINTIKSLFTLIALLPSTLLIPTALYNMVPSIIAVSISVVVAIAVVKVIVGRDNP